MSETHGWFLSMPVVCFLPCNVAVQLTHVKMHKLLQVCKQIVTSLFTSCEQVVFALLVSSLL